MLRSQKRRGKSTSINTGSNSLLEFSKKYGIPQKKLDNLVNDLIKYQGKSIIHCGTTLPEEVHIAVNYLNDLLGNNVLYRSDAAEVTLLPLTKNIEWENLIAKMNSGKVGAVIHFDCNPVFHFADDYGYETALKKVPTVISLTDKENESSELGNFVLPINHDFESWGDYKTRTGFYSLQQPVIAPLYNSRQKEAILLNWINGNANNYSDKLYHEYLMKRWETEVYPAMNSAVPFDRFWFSALHDGVVNVSEDENRISSFNSAALSGLNQGNSEMPGYSISFKE